MNITEKNALVFTKPMIKKYFAETVVTSLKTAEPETQLETALQ